MDSFDTKTDVSPMMGAIMDDWFAMSREQKSRALDTETCLDPGVLYGNPPAESRAKSPEPASSTTTSRVPGTARDVALEYVEGEAGDTIAVNEDAGGVPLEEDPGPDDDDPYIGTHSQPEPLARSGRPEGVVCSWSESSWASLTFGVEDHSFPLRALPIGSSSLSPEPSSTIFCPHHPGIMLTR